MSLRRRLLACLVGLLALLGVPAWACSCAGQTMAEAASAADAVAHVRIDRIEMDVPGGVVHYTVTPLHVWKGSFDTSFLVRTASDEASCGLGERFLRDELLLFATAEGGGRYSTTLCSGTVTWSEQAAGEISRILGPGAEASLDPTYPVGEPRIDGVEPNLTSAIIAGTVLATMLGMVLMMMFSRRRARRRR